MTEAAVKLTDQEAYELRQQERDQVAREQMARKLESARLIMREHTDQTPEYADETFKAAVQAAKTIVQFADWSEDLTYCQFQQVAGLCFGSASNIRYSNTQLDKLRDEWRALPNRADEITENRRQGIMKRAERIRNQTAYWTWLHEVNLEAYRQVVAEIKANDGTENQYFSTLSSEWQDPRQPKARMESRPTALQAEGNALFGLK